MDTKHPLFYVHKNTRIMWTQKYRPFVDAQSGTDGKGVNKLDR